MAKVTKKKGGRVTPKGGATRRPAGTDAHGDPGPHHASQASSRYTPPIPKYKKVSPPWVPVLMFALVGLGALVIVFNYLGVLLPGATDNWYLLAGLVCILGGIVTATQWH
ncbi:MAG: cell division protein CrgA [Acidimicrobiales bacterium]|nr:cell division protein CrgA [Acidimicrobiales bacterium]